jgi:nitroimidazol reductase NimA-like FMN-containing flavoprotein (pyridoxamine 5'-phosphate oxidase superfamily)
MARARSPSTESPVRRKDYEERDAARIRAFLDAATHGFLAFNRGGGSPGLVALNFARLGETLYFHGSPEGEKMRALAADPRVTFMVAEGFAFVPSYYVGPKLACPATQYYKAVIVRGEARALATREEKALALQALMEKLQPEGGYEPITPLSALYRKSLDTTAVLALPMTEVTAKFKFGQNRPARKRREIAGRLEARGGPRDAETAATMAAVCPFDSR